MFKLNKSYLLALGLSVLILTLMHSGIVGAQPAQEPPEGNVNANFDSVKLPSGPKMTGSFGKFLGLTDATTKGNMGGYNGAQGTCEAKFPGRESHVCSSMEIIQNYEDGVISGSGAVWINNGPPAFYSDVSNDCFGWTSDNSVADVTAKFGSGEVSIYGSVWNFDKNAAFMATCDRNLKVACCAY